MKNNSRSLVSTYWRILTDVPGWPDAPRHLRIRRILPIALPLAAILVLLLWNYTWIQPRIRAERTAHQPLLALEQEVAALEFAGSDTHATELAARAAEASQMLLKDPKQLAPVLAALTKAARAQGWNAVYSALPGSAIPPDPDAPIYFASARGNLLPSPDNTQPFASLLVLLEQFSPDNRSIDLTRLTIRADEQGRHTAEVYLRAGCRVSP